MDKVNKLKVTLKTGSGTSFGCWQMIPGTTQARIMARSGVDWVLVDTELGNIDDRAMYDAVPAISACGVSPLVRIASGDLGLIPRALNAGAHGIMIPHLEGAAQAKAIVDAAKFPPKGSRGFGTPFPLEAFGNPGIGEYLMTANDHILTIVQIECVAALNAVDEIAAVDGIDVLFVGAYDLGLAIGHPILTGTPDEELKAAIAKVLAAAKKAGKYAGIFCIEGSAAREYADQGFHMVSVTADAFALPATLGQNLKLAKGKGAEKL